VTATDHRRASDVGYGKPSEATLDAILKHRGSKAADLIVPPARGFDNGVLKLGSGRVLVFTADPISFIPSIGARLSAWLSLHHLASDLATSGVLPRYAVVDYNLPVDFGDRSFRAYAVAFGRECGKLGVTIIGGHTGRYPGCGLSIIGGAVLFAEADQSGYVTLAMAAAGDRVVVTKGPALEASAVLAHSFPFKVREALGPGILSKAKGRLLQCSTLADSLVAASVGIRLDGITSMHDATEGGVVTALSELATASGKEIAVDLRLIPVPEDVGRVCSLFGLNPFETLSEGTLIVTCRPAKVAKLVRALLRNGIECFEVGEVREGNVRNLGAKKSMRLSPRTLPHEKYWDVYAQGIEAGWR